jgi:hypothetical protein
VLFLAVWLAIAATNMWLGVANAGYSVSVEFPIFALIFAVPAATAVLARCTFCLRASILKNVVCP